MPKVFPIQARKPTLPVGPWPVDPVVASIALAGLVELRGTLNPQTAVSGRLEFTLPAGVAAALVGLLELSSQAIPAHGQAALSEIALAGGSTARASASGGLELGAQTVPAHAQAALPAAELRGEASARAAVDGDLELGAQPATVHATPSLSPELQGSSPASAEVTLPRAEVVGQVHATAAPSGVLEVGAQSAPASAAPALSDVGLQGESIARALPALSAGELQGSSPAHAQASMPAAEMQGVAEGRAAPALSSAALSGAAAARSAATGTLRLTALLGSDAVTQDSAGGRTDWQNITNAQGANDGTLATIAGNVVAARGGQLRLNYPNLGMTAFTILSVNLHFYVRQQGTILNNGDFVLKYSRTGNTADEITLETITGNADSLSTPRTFDITSAITSNGGWSDLDTIWARVSFISNGGETQTADVDAVILEIVAEKTI